MDSKQKKIAAVAVVVVIIVAIAAAYALTRDNDKSGENNTVTFLIQDNYDVYFWIEGSGDTVYDAWKDATTSFGITYTPTTYSGAETGISSMFNLSTTQDEAGNYIYWAQYSFVDGEWTFNDLTMNNIASTSVDYVAVVYSAYGSTPSLETPGQAKVWDKSTSGTVFTIESPSGMYFRINGTGTTVCDAWVNAMQTYNINYEVSESTYGNGVLTMFGLTMMQAEDYEYWGEYCVQDGAWVLSDYVMGNIQSADYPTYLLSYGTYGHSVTAPVA